MKGGRKRCRGRTICRRRIRCCQVEKERVTLGKHGSNICPLAGMYNPMSWMTHASLTAEESWLELWDGFSLFTRGSRSHIFLDPSCCSWMSVTCPGCPSPSLNWSQALSLALLFLPSEKDGVGGGGWGAVSWIARVKMLLGVFLAPTQPWYCDFRLAIFCPLTSWSSSWEA